MKFIELIPLAWKTLLVNKGRSVLTMLGIVIGIMSVILMIAVGQAAQRYLLTQIASFGSDLVFIANGQGDETRGGPPDATIKQTLTVKDYQKLKALNWPRAVAGSVISKDLISYGGEDKFTSIVGGSPDEILVFNTVVKQGRFLDDTDIDGHARVIVLGADVGRQLFGEEDPMNKTIRVAKQPFRVIGLMGEAGTRFFSNADDQVYVPFTTFMDIYHKNRLNFLSVKTGNVSPRAAKDLIRTVLRESHNLNNPDGVLAKDDFRVASQEDSIKSADTIGTVLQVLLGSIASISLLVAGVGIMNIMYVTVTERTREIGLRKSLGARRRDVLRQFLLEAILLTCVAGSIGMIVGISLSWLAIAIISRFQAGWSFAVPWNGVILSVGVSAAIGIVFGYFPARKAATLDPIEALRYE